MTNTNTNIETKQSYPFPSKRQIVDEIDTNDTAAVRAVVKLTELDAAMCSQKKAVEALAIEVTEVGIKEAAADADLVTRCRSFARRYGRRLAKEARAEQIAAHPELAELAEKFSANV